MEFKVSKLKEEHLEALAELEKLCFSEPRSLKSLRQDFENPLSFYLVATLENGEVAAYLGCQEVCGEANIHNIAVTPQHRRKGIGKALLKEACSGAGERGCDFVTLEVRAGNHAAIALYESLGFKLVGRRRDYYTNPKDDALLMTLYFKRDGKKTIGDCQ